MKKIILGLFFFITYFQIFSQELLLPVKSESFGLNHHTNRDMSFFSKVDSNKNLLIVGTTEKDSTFTDVIATKLDKNLNVVWQKIVSQNTNLSYDIPVKSFISPHNELYIIGRSALKQSYSTGILFIIKFNENGQILYNKTIGNEDGSDYVDYSYLDADLNPDGSLSLVYAPVDNLTLDGHDFRFLKINNDGDIIRSFTKKMENNGVVSKIQNQTFYILVKEPTDDVHALSTHKFHKIKDENNQSSFEITDSIFANYYYNSPLFNHIQMNIDTDENCYIVGFNSSSHHSTDKINISKIDTNNKSWLYSITTSASENYYLLGSFINEQNQNIIIANNLNSNAMDFISVNENNTIEFQTNPSSLLGTGFKYNEDGTFFLTSSNSNLRLFSNTLTELKEFTSSNTFELVDFSKIDDQTIAVIGTSYDKMFPESDFYTQLDIKAEKIDDSQILHNFSFSGIGTSRSFQHRLVINNDNNYLLMVSEKMGPEYLGKGGAKPPLNERIIKYDSNLNKLWEVEVPENIFNLITFQGKTIDYHLDEHNILYLNLPRAGDHFGIGYDLYKMSPDGVFEFINHTYVSGLFHVNQNLIFMSKDYYEYEDVSKMYILNKENGNLLQEINIGHENFLEIFSIGNDNYFYTYEVLSNNTPDFLYLYKNGVKVFTRALSYNYGIYPIQVDKDGSLFFVTKFNYDNIIHKVDINNSYSHYKAPSPIHAYKKFNNGKMYVSLQNNNTVILDENLNFITNGEPTDTFNPYLLPHGNHMLLATSFDKSLRIIDQSGSVVNHFKIQGHLDSETTKFDKNDNLIVVGNFGDRISTYNEYGWYRGFLHSYGLLDNILNLEDFDDSSKIKNDLVIYPNPTSDLLHIKLRNQEVESIRLYNLSGKLLKEFDTSTIDLKSFETGIYLIKIRTKSGTIINSKVTKIR